METAEITNGLESREGGWRSPCQARFNLVVLPKPHYQTWSKFLVTRLLQRRLSGQLQRVSEGGVCVGGDSLSYWLVQDTAQLKIKDD